MKQLLFLLLIGASFVQSRAQEFSIKTVELTADQIVLHYDLIDSTKNRTYTIFVYTSKDNFLAPITKLSGDAGLEVKPGINKRIVWNSKEELGNAFEGDVELEVRGRVYIPFIRFDSFDKVTSRKRGMPFIVKWSGGTRQNILNFELYKGGKLVYTFPNIGNNYEYKVVLPTTVKPGKGYFFKISDSKDKDQVVLTSTFGVKRKVPLLLKAIPVVAVGGLVYLFTSGKKGVSDLDPPPPIEQQQHN